jgi:hypothetical protein
LNNPQRLFGDRFFVVYTDYSQVDRVVVKS